MHRNRAIVVLLAAWLVVGMAVSEPAFGQDQFIGYRIDAEFDPEQHLIFGSQLVDYINDSTDPIESIFFLLLPNLDQERNPHLDISQIDASYQNGFDPAWTKIERVQDVTDEDLKYEMLEGPAIFQTFSLKDNLLEVKLPQALEPGSRTQITVHFRTKFPHSFRGDDAYYRDTYTWRFGWNPIAIPAQDLISGEYISDERPYYQFALPSGLYELNLTLPTEYVAALGADYVEEFESTEHLKVLNAKNDIPSRSIPITISPDFNVLQYPDLETEILVYYLHSDEQDALLIGKYAADSLNYYRDKWGEFPHQRLVIAETPSTNASFGGAAADSFILINQVYFREKDLAVSGFMDRLVDYLLAHEVAHQWWGVGVGVDWNAENFLSESFAQYFSITYFEDKYGEYGPNVFQIKRDGLLERAIESQFGYINLREHMQGDVPYIANHMNSFDEALIKPQENVEFSNSNSIRLYNKGYMMLRALEGMLESEGMDEFLKLSHERFVHQVANLEEMEVIAEQIYDRDLSEFFQKALYEDVDESGAAPFADFAIEDVVTTQIDAETYEHKVHLARYGELRMPVNVLVTETSGDVQSRMWEVEDQLESQHIMIFETTDSLKEVGVDPKNMSPDIKRLNNYYVLDGYALFNRRLHIITSGQNAMPLDGFMVRINPFSQYLEGGYLLDHRWLIGNGVIGFSKNLGRGSVINSLAALSTEGIWGQVSYSKLFFTHPETGFKGKFWQASNQLEVSYLRRPDTTGRPFYDRRSGATGDVVNAFGLTWIHQEQIQARYALWGRLMIDPVNFHRVEMGGWNSIRLAPGMHIDTRGTVGWGEGIAGIFRFNLTQLGGYTGAVGYPFFGDAFMHGRIDLRLPFQREMGYNMVNVAVLHNMDERIFFEFGNIWPDLETAQNKITEGIRSQVGFEVTLSGRTLGGLFPWSVTLGMVYPLTNIDEDQRLLRQYISFNTPFF